MIFKNSIRFSQRLDHKLMKPGTGQWFETRFWNVKKGIGFIWL